MPSVVALARGPDRKPTLRDALDHIDDPASRLDHPESVILKPNLVSDTRQLATTHVDTVDTVMEWFEDHGITDFTVAASSAHDTDAAFQRFDYHTLTDDHDATLRNLDAGTHTDITLDYDPHPLTIPVADPLLDDTPIVSIAKPKTHNTVIATLTLKNVLMGSIRQTPDHEDKRRMHQGTTEINHYLARLASHVAPDIGILDGHRSMQGNGPTQGDPIDHHIAIASHDPLAADHVALLTMGIDPTEVGYLAMLGEGGFGAYSAGEIEVVGEAVADCRREYELHETVGEQLEWRW